MRRGVPGLILLWYGTLATIPSGWQLCDGTNGTPDLRGRFVIGAGVTYNPGDTGGAISHAHGFTGDGHYHNLSAGTDIESGVGYQPFTLTSAISGTTNAQYNLPTYTAYCYIMCME